MVTVTTCGRCGGRGHWVEHPCEPCQGNGYEFIPHTLKITIPRGVDDGMVVRLAGQGELNANGGPPGDLLIRTHLQPHSSLERHGDDLYTLVTITFPQAALGDKVTVTGLGGDTLRLTVPAGTQSGTTLRIEGKGMPRLGRKAKGDLMAIVEVKTPTDLSSEQRQLLEKFAQLEAQRRAGTPHA
jgi:molecular chaperone DnaJ